MKVRGEEPIDPEPSGESSGPPVGAETAGDPEATAGLPVEVAEEAIKRLEGERDELRDRLLRLAADFDNFRKRTAKERQELADRAQAGLAIRLLEVLDDLDRLVAGDQVQAPHGAIHEAMVLIDRKLRKELEAAGLERIDPAGAAFDPGLHEAVSAIPPPDPSLDHTVSATFQSGYRFRGALIRPARVQVYSTQGHA